MAENEEEQPAGEESRDFKRVRERAEAAEAEIVSLKTKLLARTIKEAGFDPAAGIVQMIADKFDGDIEDVDAFAEHAKALGYSGSVESEKKDDTAEQVGILQNRSDALRDLAKPAEPAASIDEQIAEAERAGDWTASRSLKNQKVASQVRGG